MLSFRGPFEPLAPVKQARAAIIFIVKQASEKWKGAEHGIVEVVYQKGNYVNHLAFLFGAIRW